MGSRYTAPKRDSAQSRTFERLRNAAREPNNRSETSRAGMTPGNDGAGVFPSSGVMQIPAPGEWKIGILPSSRGPLVSLQCEYERGIFTDWMPADMARQLVKAIQTVILQAETGLVVADRIPGQ